MMEWVKEERNRDNKKRKIESHVTIYKEGIYNQSFIEKF